MSQLNRVTVALTVLVVAVVFSLTSWVDPLEGVVGVFAGAVGTWGVWAIGRVTLPVITWAATSFAVAVCVVIWVGLITSLPAGGDGSTTGTAWVPDWILAALWVYRVACVAMIAGLVMYLVVHINERKKLTAR